MKFASSSYPFVILASIAAIAAGGAARALAPPENAVVKKFCDAKTDESEVIDLYAQIRDTAPTDAEIPDLARVANSDKFSENRRRLAIYSLVERHCPAGIRVADLAKRLGKPSWLKRRMVHASREFSGPLLIADKDGEMVFDIRLRLSDRDPTALLIRVPDTKVSEGALYDALMGKATAAANLTVTAIAMQPPGSKLLVALRRLKK